MGLDLRTIVSEWLNQKAISRIALVGDDMNQLLSRVDHKPSVLALYRSLLRRCKAVETVTLPNDGSKVSEGHISQELDLARTNPSLYTQYLASDIKHSIRQRFRAKISNTLVFYRSYSRGVQLVSLLDDISNNSDNFVSLLEFVLHFKQREFDLVQKKAHGYYLKGVEEFNGILPKPDAEKFPWPLKPFKSLQNHEREKRLKHEISESKENKHKVIRRYMKHLQMNHKLAVPQLLPYTNLNLPAPNIKLSSKIYDSTSVKSITLGYNLNMVAAILEPELEFNVNYHGFLKPLEQIVNEKGPYQVKIRTTNAGATSIPYIKLPMPQLDKMKEIAMDIKKLAKDFTLHRLWESSHDDPGSKEKRNADGSYSIGWFKQYGPNARIFSKDVLASLYQDEAKWEFELELASLKTQGEDGKMVNPEDIKQDLMDIKNSYIDSWMEALDITSAQLLANWQSYGQKYNQHHLDKLLVEQKQYQQKMNQHFQSQINRYNNIKTLLEEAKASMHSDLVSPKVLESLISNQLLLDDRYVKKTRTGISLSERRGLNKKLGDYMDQANMASYKLGMKYETRFKF